MNKIRPKRHCMVVYARYPLGETRVQREAEALLKNGYEVDVVCIMFPGDLAVDVYKGVKIYRESNPVWSGVIKSEGLQGKFLAYIFFFLSAFFRVARLHLSKPYGTIQVHNLPDFLVFSALLPKILGVPVILDLHDLMPEFYAGHFGSACSLGARLVRLQERWSCKFADHVITVSEHWRQALIRRGVPENKLSVVMNVADESIFYPDTPGDGNSKSPKMDGFGLIYHGSIVERYGLDLVVQAVDRVKQTIPGIHLTLIGWGGLLPRLRQMVDDLGLHQYVTFIDSQLAENLPDLIRSHHLGIVAYRDDVFTGGLLPTKLMEYAALGLPAVAARTSAIEAYFANTNVEFFKPGDVEDLAQCLVRLYNDPTRLSQLAAGSKFFTDRYSWQKISHEYVDMVEHLRLRD